MEDGSAGLPRLWPAHAGLAEDGLYVLEQYHIKVIGSPLLTPKGFDLEQRNLVE